MLEVYTILWSFYAENFDYFNNLWNEWYYNTLTKKIISSYF